jgi:arsenite methyltransferase
VVFEMNGEPLPRIHSFPARLFTVVDGSRALAEIHRVLRPGGRCCLAEPVSVMGTLLPFAALRLAGWLAGLRSAQDGEGSPDRGPRRLTGPELAALVRSQPWSDCNVTHEQGYLYAICQQRASQSS